MRKKAPELTFQEHIAAYLGRGHEYLVLEQAKFTDTEHFIAEDHLRASLNATQKGTLNKLVAVYGESVEEDRQIAEEGMQDYSQGLRREDRA